MRLRKRKISKKYLSPMNDPTAVGTTPQPGPGHPVYEEKMAAEKVKQMHGSKAMQRQRAAEMTPQLQRMHAENRARRMREAELRRRVKGSGK
jgi:hypothetical protein